MIVEDALKLSVYFGDAHTTSDQRLTSDALLDCLEERKVAFAVLFRGVEGFGIGRRIHTTRFPDISVDLPLVAVVIDGPARIREALEDVDRVTRRGLVTLERSTLASGDDVSELSAPPGFGNAHELTIYCGRGERLRGRPSYRVIVDTLRTYGAAGATTLFGVDGVRDGRRERAHLFGRNTMVPTAIISVGRAEPMQQTLADIRRLHPTALVSSERVSFLKHDGELLGEPPSPESLPEHDIWQMIKIYTRQSAHIDGHALYTELTRRLRVAGASGVTTLLGDWGFSSDEEPFGDGIMPGHRPSVTIFIDTPAKVADAWPMIDELTSEHGVVTSLFVPGYRERADQYESGRLSVPDRELP